MMIKSITAGIIIASAVAVTGCGSARDKSGNHSSDAMDVAVGFVEGKFKRPVTEYDNEGNASIREEGISLMTEPVKFVVEKNDVFTGDIDGDGDTDAIVSAGEYRGNSITGFEHIIITNADGIMSLNRVIESNMIVFGIKDGIITAEVHTHPPTSPLYDCDSCKEVVRFRFESGELIRTR